MDLRKTARGASSPAKPALHIPDLRLYELCLRLPLFSQALARDCLGMLSRGSLLDMWQSSLLENIPIVDDERCNFFCVDPRDSVSSFSRLASIKLKIKGSLVLCIKDIRLRKESGGQLTLHDGRLWGKAVLLERMQRRSKGPRSVPGVSKKCVIG